MLISNLFQGNVCYGNLVLSEFNFSVYLLFIIDRCAEIKLPTKLKVRCTVVARLQEKCRFFQYIIIVVLVNDHSNKYAGMRHIFMYSFENTYFFDNREHLLIFNKIAEFSYPNVERILNVDAGTC